MHSTDNITESGIELKMVPPPPQLSDFVESFWMLKNASGTTHETIGLPDGRFDIIFSYSSTSPFRAMLMGLGTEPGQHTIAPGIVMCAVSFKLLAIEYLLDIKAGTLLNTANPLPQGFWGITKQDLDDFDAFCKRVTEKMLSMVKPGIDSRKQKLFDLIYTSNGTMPVKELSAQVFWSSRQINRYFNEYFGISLKAYCSILRFKTSLYDIKKGKLFPGLDYADQAHFIKEVKKFAGAVPKELFRNTNDRFILLSALPKK